VVRVQFPAQQPRLQKLRLQDRSIFLPFVASIQGEVMDEDEQQQEPQNEITPQQMARFKNLKAFKGWSDEAIKDYMRNRPKKAQPPPRLFSDSTNDEPEPFSYDASEYKKKYDTYFRKYIKEYGVDMNETNDVQALQSLVRLIIQAEVVNENILRLHSDKTFSSKVLKDMGDFQRSVQMSLKELQEQLGISRKTRKEKQADDIPQYIRQLQVRAMEKWNRSTEPIRCEKCKIELARAWYNFPHRVLSANMTIICDKCEETVVYSR
jgi:hypothetical protein